MRNDFAQRLISAVDSLSESRHESHISADGNIIQISSRPEGLVIYLFFILLVLGPPAAVLVEEQSYGSSAVAIFWMLMSGSIFYKLTGGDMSTRFDLTSGSVEISSNNPLVLWMRSHHMNVTYSWEGRYLWTRFTRVVIKEKQYGKWSINRGHRLYFESPDDGSYPFAEFRNRSLAGIVASVISEMTGMRGAS